MRPGAAASSDERFWVTERKALRVIHTKLSQLSEDRHIFYALGNRLFSHNVCDLMDGTNHREIDRVVHNAFYKRPPQCLLQTPHRS